jgi:hypothetical protein
MMFKLILKRTTTQHNRSNIPEVQTNKQINGLTD